jgi:hypothetical protein
MVKTILHTIIILLVSGLVAGGIYLFVQNGGMSLNDGGVGLSEGFGRGLGNGPGFTPGSAPIGAKGFPQGGGFGGGHDEPGGFSLAGFSGVLMQLVKVAAITVFVVIVQAVIRQFKRIRKTTRPAAA